jgi:hypothetical protein
MAMRESIGATNVELLNLGPVDKTGRRRSFDASDGGSGIWRGVLSYDGGWKPPRLYVFTDRDDPLDAPYACRPGELAEVTDAERAAQVIIGGLTGMPTSRLRGVISVQNGEVVAIHEDGLY